MQPVLFDTSIYIEALRTAADVAVEARRLSGGAPVWMSAVVLGELFAGVNRREREHVEKLEQTFERAGRVLIPNAGDWAQAGTLISLVAARHGYEKIGRGRLMNDALIATSARRTGTLVVTANERDFSRLADLRPFRWRFSSAHA
jgi:tRNA(fMet)-specific endonuclease VapC